MSREAAGRAGGSRERGMRADGAGTSQSLCGEDLAHEPLPARGNCDGLWSTWLHGMAEVVRTWWWQGCPEMSIGPVWRQMGMETPVSNSPQRWGGPVTSRLPSSWLGAISCLVPVNYGAPGSQPYRAFCRSPGLKLSRSLGKPFPLLK